MTAPATIETPTTFRRWRNPAGVVAVLGALTAYTAIRNPHVPGAFPLCPLYQATGFYCPGCGGLRAAHDLLHGDVASSLAMNPLVLLLIVPLGLVGLAWWMGRVAGLNLPEFAPSTRAAWVLPTFLFAFWVIRNLPGFEFLRP